MVDKFKFFTKIKKTGTMLYIKIPNDMKDVLEKGEYVDVTISKRKQS